MNSTIQDLFTELSIPLSYNSEGLNKLATADSRYLKDLKLNVAAVLKSNYMERKEAYLLALSVAVNQKTEVLITAFETWATEEGASEAEIAEIHACTSLMNTNNVFYRFRHYLPQAKYYHDTPAALRMGIMAKPILSREFFELVSLAVSALNGCELCVTSHESSVKSHGANEARIYDAIRLAAVIRGLTVLF